MQGGCLSFFCFFLEYEARQNGSGILRDTGSQRGGPSAVRPAGCFSAKALSGA